LILEIKARWRASGITLIEVMIGLVVLGVLGMMAVPSWAEFQERQRLKAAAETLASSLNLARSEALAQQQFTYVQLSGQGSERWCYAVAASPNCDCQASCDAIQRVEGQSWPGVMLSSSSRKVFRFNWKNGSATGANGTATLIGAQSDQRLCVVLSNLGRVRMTTSKQKPVPGYPQDAGCR
jgi:type IV fimbrial biogenesis protein FimT